MAEALICCICLNDSKDYELIPLKCCLKHVVCWECFCKIDRCPLCRKEIGEAQEIKFNYLRRNRPRKALDLWLYGKC